ncbi:MAG: ABC transporter permease [Proteobacteria bacterium]|nr:ABC transporter permease [Pseudomonadota bacterium]MBU1697126.1 ABC transporter permease [Pseudomonadota bacterium]
MLKYIIKRVLWMIPTLIGVLIILFSLTYMLPGDPATAMLGPRATPELVAALNTRLHLDESMPVRLGYYLFGIVKGDLGTSVWSGHKVGSLIFTALPHTVLLAICSLGIAAVIGIFMGAFGAVRQNSVISRIVTIVSLVGVAVPDFVAALLLMLLFCVQFPILPAIGAGTEDGITGIAVHLILPATALGIGWVGYLSRLTRESMVDVLDSDYIRTARAFAIPQRLIAYSYALKNAIIPTITVIGLGVGKLLGGAVFVEIIFNRPGLGKLIVDAVYARDFPVVQGGILVATIFFVLANLLADISYGFVNPQIQYD